jgi:catechol 2,3-dioxygenase-like lactoylglutathione lyase family enzyme
MKRALLLLACPWIASAQLPAGNEAGVAMGHLHFKTTAPELHRNLWVDVLGGVPGKLGARDIVTLPGTVVLWEKAEPAGGTNGSVVGHIGFKVRDLSGVLARAKENGIAVESEKPAFLSGPDGVRIELIEDKSLDASTAHHHIHFYNGAVAETQAWYARMFGARPGKRGNFEAADLPGANLTFSKAEQPTAPTKGRALDHIGFEVNGLEAFAKKLEAAGVKLDVPFRTVPALGISLVFFTDPWGTYIELTEGLRK